MYSLWLAFAACVVANSPIPLDWDTGATLSKRDDNSSSPAVKYPIDKTDLSLWLYANKDNKIKPLNAASLTSTLSDLSQFIGTYYQGKTQPLSKTNDDPLVWQGASTLMDPSERLTLIMSNRPAGDALDTSQAKNVVDGLQAFLKQNSTFDFDSAYIVQNNGSTQANEVGLLGSLSQKRSTASPLVTPVNSTFTLPVPMNDSLSILVNLSDAPTRGFVDPVTMLDMLTDATEWTQLFSSEFYNENLKVQGHSVWPFRKHSANNNNTNLFELLVSPQADDAGWSTLNNVLKALAQGFYAKGYYYGSAFSVLRKDSSNVVFNGTILGNGTDPVHSTSSASNPPVAAPGNGPANGTATNNGTASDNAPANGTTTNNGTAANGSNGNLIKAKTPNFFANASRVDTKIQNTDDNCKKFTDKTDTNPNPFAQVVSIFSSSPLYGNFSYKGTVVYYVKLKTIGGKSVNNLGVVATLTPCMTGTTTNSQAKTCDEGIFGYDVTPLRDFISPQSLFCGSVGGTYGSKNQYNFMLQLSVQQNPTFQAFDAIHNSAPGEPDWAR